MSATPTIPDGARDYPTLTAEREPLVVSRTTTGFRWCDACNTVVDGPVVRIAANVGFEVHTYPDDVQRFEDGPPPHALTLCDIHASAMARDVMRHLTDMLSNAITYGEVR